MTDSELYEWFKRKAENTPIPGAHEAFLSAADAFKERIERNNGWISVKERLPENKQTVLFCEASGFIYCAQFFKGFPICGKKQPDEWFVDNDCWTAENVTHWMPLPEPPCKEKK